MQGHVRQDSWNASPQPLLWGAAATVAAFSAVIVGLVGSGAALTPWQHLWLAIAALVPGCVAYVQARIDLRRRAVDQEAAADLRSRLTALQQLLQQHAEDEAVERGLTAVTLGRLGTTLAQLISDAFGDPGDLPVASGRFAQIVVDALHEVLSRDGRRGLLRVVFLQHHSAFGAAVSALERGRRPVYTARWASGHRADVTWELFADARDAKVARALMDHAPPWDTGGLVIDDVAKPEYAGGYLVLLPPDPDVASLLRVAVVDGGMQHGILCVDSWSPGALSVADQTVAESFAALLAAGLAAATVLGRDVSAPPRRHGS